VVDEDTAREFHRRETWEELVSRDEIAATAQCYEYQSDLRVLPGHWL
jgi:hypothetical protein